MWKRPPRSRSDRARLALAGAALLGVLAAAPARAQQAQAQAQQAEDDARLDASYPMGAPSAATFAGVSVAQLALPALRLVTRDDRTVEHGGITLSFADDQRHVRAVVRVAVARDAAGARAFVRSVLRGVSGVLAPSALDEVAFADDGGRGDRFVVAAHGNVAYVVDALDGAMTASSIAALVKKTMVAGTPAFPQARVVLPASIDRADAHGAPVSVSGVSAGTTVRLHATGGYLTRLRGADVVHAFGAGSVEVTAVVGDALGRVVEVRGTSTAR